MRSPDAIPTTTLQRAIARLGVALGVGMVACLVLVAIGKVFSDRFHWSQYLSWVPTLLACLVATPGLVVSWLLTRPRRQGRWVRRGGWTLIALGVLYATQIEWAGGEAPPGPPREQRLRLVYWNFSESGEPGWESSAISQDPDLVVVRAGTCTQPAGVRARMGEHAAFCWDDGFMVTSRLPIKAWGSGSLNVEQGLGLDPRQGNLIRTGRDPGRAMWLLLDAHASLGRDVVVWLIDMPSDLSLSRVNAMEEAFVAMVNGPAKRWIPGGVDGWTEASDSALSRNTFRIPDLIIGDFNTPHGSYSLRTISQGYPSAYDQAGTGHAATFPRAWALWQLDQAFLAPWLRACRHDAIDTGSGSHRMLIVDVERFPTR